MAAFLTPVRKSVAPIQPLMVPKLHSTAHVLAHVHSFGVYAKRTSGAALFATSPSNICREGAVASAVTVEMAPHRPAESSGQEADVAGEAYSRARQHVGRQYHRGANTMVAIA